MKYKDLRDFIAALEERGELRRITTEVDPYLEMTEIADRTLRAGGPALLFENPKGYDTPVLANLFGTEQRVALGMGAERLEAARRADHHGEVDDLPVLVEANDVDPVELLILHARAELEDDARAHDRRVARSPSAKPTPGARDGDARTTRVADAISRARNAQRMRARVCARLGPPETRTPRIDIDSIRLLSASRAILLFECG